MGPLVWRDWCIFADEKRKKGDQGSAQHLNSMSHRFEGLGQHMLLGEHVLLLCGNRRHQPLVKDLSGMVTEHG